MEVKKRKLGDVRDVAEALGGCHVATVWRGIAAGTIPQPIRIGGRTLWDMGEIDALIAAKLAERKTEAA